MILIVFRISPEFSVLDTLRVRKSGPVAQSVRAQS
mgnify:CR=1 FL=1